VEQPKNMKKNRVLIIGLDGASLDVLEPWARAGQLPSLYEIMRTGSYGRLESVFPIVSSAAWTSFMTGTNPGKHGLFDFVRRDADSYRLRPVNRTHSRGVSIWKYLSQEGKKVVVLNVPMTYPVEELNGVIVAGLGAPLNKKFTHPLQLENDLSAHGYRHIKKTFYRPGNEKAELEEIYELADHVTWLAKKMIQAEDWDFFMVVYRETDEVGHFFWKDQDSNHPQHDPAKAAAFGSAILEYYQHIDHAIGELRQMAGEGVNTIIMSDHGQGALYKDVYLNEWLRQQGFLSTQSTAVNLPASKKLFSRLGLTRSGISAFLRRNHLGKLETLIKDILGDRIAVLPVSNRAEFPEGIDWSRTCAYSFGYMGQIYINLKGREPLGIVEPGQEYEDTLAKICAALYQLTDPQDGKPVVDRILRGAEIYHGAMGSHAPDLLLEMRGFAYITRKGYEFGSQNGAVFSTPATYENGSHRLEGMLVMSGPDVKNDPNRQKNASIMDLAPTILHLFGFQKPAAMDGHVLENWLNQASGTPENLTEINQVSGGPDEVPLTEEEEQEMVEQLRKLGYLN
jgi:predicted AlkP superfamily phosphohydrolase/phosphomutase